MLAFGEILQETASVELGRKNLSNDGGSPHQVVKILLTGSDHLLVFVDLGIRIVEFELFVDRKGPTDISFVLVHHGGIEERVYLVHLAAGVGVFERFEIGLKSLLVDHLRSVLDCAGISAHRLKPGLHIINRTNRAGNERIELKGGIHHLRSLGILSQLHEERCKFVGFEWLKFNVSAILGNEFEK